MKSNLLVGVSWAGLFIAGCNPSVVDPFGLGAAGGAGRSGDGGGSSGAPPEVAGESGGGAAGMSGAAGSAGESGHAGGGAAGDSGAAGEGGAAGADCTGLRSAAEDAIKSNRACIQDSDCALIDAPCLFFGRESCGNQYGISKTARAEAATAFAAYEACAGECNQGNACAPQRIAQCSEGACLNRPGPANCAVLAAQASASVGSAETCSLIARVDSVSLAVNGYALICGPRAVVDEAAARASANAAVTFTPIGLGGGAGDLLSGPAPNDVWLFKQLSGDFGHVSAVSAASGQTLFWGELIYGGNPIAPTLAGLRSGVPTAPTPWAKTEIGSGCSPSPAIPRRSWELRSGQSAGATASEQQAADRALTSAFVQGMSVKLSLTSVVTLHYGEYPTPSTPISEYIVIVSGARSN